MNHYKLQIDDKAKKQLKKLDKPTTNKIIHWLNKNVNQTTNPYQHGKALTGTLGGFWRYRIGDYRVICDIRDDELTILAIQIAHRKQVYKLKLPKR